MIRKIRVYAVKIPLTETFATALGASNYLHSVIVELITDDNIIGYGSASPSPRITGDTLETSMSAFYRLSRVIIGRNASEYASIIRDMDLALIHNSSAKAAVDIALHDLFAKEIGVPLRVLFGGPQTKSFPSSVTISLSDKKYMIKKAEELIASGVKILKIKIGHGVSEDVEIIKKIRRTVGWDVELRIDANQAYTPKKAVKLLRELENEEIEFCEQPVYWRDLDGLKFVRNNTEIPIMADESIHDPYDAIKILSEEIADMINIKIMKAGGILKSRRIAEICEEFKAPCQIGCMSETSASIVAGVHLAIAFEGIKYSDLDGHLLLVDDPFSGVIFKNSENVLSDDNGLGVALNFEILKKYMVAKLEFGE